MDRTEAIRREDRIKRLHAKGMRGSEIAQAMGVSRQRVHQLLRRLKLKPHPRSDFAQRRKKIPKMIRSGMTGSQVAREFDVPPAQIYQDLRVINDQALVEWMRKNRAAWLTKERTGKTPDALVPRIEQRRKKVKALFAKGHGSLEIAQRLKVSRPTINTDLRALGLAGQRRREVKDQAARRRAQVRKLTLQGLSGAWIAQKLGVEPQVVYNDRMWWREQGVEIDPK